MSRTKKMLVTLLAVMCLLLIGGCKPPGSSDDTAATSKTVAVTNGNSKTAQVPFVSGETIANGDTTSSTTMAPIRQLLPGCEVLKTWSDIVACVSKNSASWYSTGVDHFKMETGFGWSDVKKWAAAVTKDGQKPEQRVIQLFGNKTSLVDAEARKAVSKLVGSNQLQVVRCSANFLNTRRSGSDVQAFVDGNSEVRVSLVPLVLDKDGKVVGLNKSLDCHGIFVDCYNPHGYYPHVTVPVTPARTTKSKTATHPAPTTSTTSRPTTTHPTSPSRPTSSTHTTPPASCNCVSKATASQPVPVAAVPTNRVTDTSGPGPETSQPGTQPTSAPPGGNATEKPQPAVSSQAGGGGDNSTPITAPAW